MNDFRDIAQLLDVLQPWLKNLVIIGGWAHQLHRFHPWAHPPAYAAVRTKDADLAFAASAPLEGDLKAALAAAGFRQELTGDYHPPVSRYILGSQDGGFYAEFLVPLAGSGIKRDGEPDATLARAGITAQKLRYLDLLLASSWTVRVSPAVGVPVTAPLDVALPNPVSFIAQKLLIHTKRMQDKQAQDALYSTTLSTCSRPKCLACERSGLTRCKGCCPQKRHETLRSSVKNNSAK